MKKLNLSTAFLQMYTKLNEQDNHTPTDIAVAMQILYQLNATAWKQRNVTTTISFIAWAINSRPVNVKNSLKRLRSLSLIDVKYPSDLQNEAKKPQIRTRIVIELGSEFNDYAVVNSNQLYNNTMNSKQTTLQLAK